MHSQVHSQLSMQAFSRHAPLAGTIPMATLFGVSLLGAVILVNEANFRHTDAFDARTDWQTLLKLSICGACGLYGCLYINRTRLFTINSSAVWLCLFATWALLSAFGAINPVYSLASCAALWCLLVFAPTVLTNLGPRTVILTSLITSLAFLAGCWCMHIVLPGLNGFNPRTDLAADAGRLGGLVHPNGTARVAALAVGLIMITAKTGYMSWRQLALPLVFASVTLFCTGSRTWLVAAATVVLFAMWRYLSGPTRAIFLCFCILAAPVTGILLVAVWDTTAAEGMLADMSRRGDVEEIYSMTGRVELWEFCLQKINGSPMRGFGYGCQRFVIANEHYWQTRHAHNVLINVVLGTGLVGGVFLAVALAWQMFKLFNAPEMFPDVIVLLVVIGGITENPILNPLPGAMTLLFLISLHWRAVVRTERCGAGPDTAPLVSNSRRENHARNTRHGSAKRLVNTPTSLKTREVWR